MKNLKKCNTSIKGKLEKNITEEKNNETTSDFLGSFSSMEEIIEYYRSQGYITMDEFDEIMREKYGVPW